MITVDQYLRKIQAAKAEIKSSALTLMNNLAADTLATVQERVQEKGVSAKGGAFGKYQSDYEKWRIKQGFQVVHKDFTATGRMWQNTTIKVLANTPTRTVVYVAPTQAFEIKKMEWNSAREGVNLLALTKNERLVLQADYKQAILKIIKKHL